MMISTGYRRSTTFLISWMTAPVSDVTTPILAGNAGSSRLRSAANRPSAASSFFHCSTSRYFSPRPAFSIFLTCSWYAPWGAYTVTEPETITSMPSSGVNASRSASDRHITHLMTAAVLPPAFFREREVAVAPAMVLVVGDLAPDPDVLQPGVVEEFPDDCRELGDQERCRPAARWFFRGTEPVHQQLLGQNRISNRTVMVPFAVSSMFFHEYTSPEIF